MLELKFAIWLSLKNEWYIVIKAYKSTVFEILRDFYILLVHASLHIKSTDSMATCHNFPSVLSLACVYLCYHALDKCTRLPHHSGVWEPENNARTYHPKCNWCSGAPLS